MKEEKKEKKNTNSVEILKASLEFTALGSEWPVVLWAIALLLFI